jgi:hypothetical protein
VILFILSIIVQTSYAYDSSCFSRHLDEAIQLNENRKQLYSELTNGDSEQISSKLIRQERWAKIFAFFYDWRAETYQENGIPVVCDEFVSMSLTPPFVSYQAPQVRVGALPELPIGGWEDELNNKEDFDQLAQASLQMVHSLNELPDYFCMTRHLLESIVRSARLAPSHIEKSLQANLDSPRDLLQDFIELHVDGLQDAYELDRMAFPMQAKGIPILCRDVPAIPLN